MVTTLELNIELEDKEREILLEAHNIIQDILEEMENANAQKVTIKSNYFASYEYSYKEILDASNIYNNFC